jgi:hypothetical protein
MAHFCQQRVLYHLPHQGNVTVIVQWFNVQNLNPHTKIDCNGSLRT